ncbi:MAG TPA: T9SS type A sorting domain-containing protein [Chitinophagaceae bacterium]|nr:T9SS type A sorting domain-containing protein [Chitinophagaceae bacterium]
MNKTVPLITFLMLLAGLANAQIVTPIIRANFGVDADLKANFFNGSADAGNDDWFNDGTPGSGVFVIDTTGAAAIMSQYLIDTTYRRNSFFRGMNYPMYSTVNGNFFYDALYVRDHSKIDSTAFVSSNKNGQSPAIWDGGTTPVPSKNDINDVMIHVRRDGPALTDSLWFFAGLSLHGNTGNRYFDFELYQSDIYYSKTDNKFHNYGAEAGHTAWQFDAMGNVTKPGDIIFTAEFGSSSLTSLEARIWIDKASLLLTPLPSQFTWGGAFDGDGSSAQYGYASIVPKTAGIFYGGNQCSDNTWAGPFGFIDLGNVLHTNYSSRDYMEIAVNMTKIGLDPYTILGSSGCNLSFKRVFAKTRSSTSFTSSLQDFIGPYPIARPILSTTADMSLFCGAGPGNSQVSVINPISTSSYTWTTTDGHIVTSPATGTSVTVDQPGSYIVTQTLMDGCAPYSTDTITLIKDADRCIILAAEDIRFSGKNNNQVALLNWTSSGKDITRFDVERSIDGKSFKTIAIANAVMNGSADHAYSETDLISNLNSKLIYYRLKISKTNSQITYSKVITIKNTNALSEEFVITPNPATDYLQVIFRQMSRSKIAIRIYNSTGSEVQSVVLKSETEKVNLREFPPGIYFVHANSQDGLVTAQKKLLITR